MNWNVFRRDPNTEIIEVINVFDHFGFRESLKKLYKKRLKLTKIEFKEELRHIAMYYFWSKYEYEISLSEPFPRIKEDEIKRLIKEYETFQQDKTKVNFTCHVDLECYKKIDIYDQLSLNWDIFADYVYSNINLLK